MVSLQNWQISLLAQGKDLNINLLMVEIFYEGGEEEIELDGWLEGRLQTDLHNSGGGVENF